MSTQSSNNLIEEKPVKRKPSKKDKPIKVEFRCTGDSTILKTLGCMEWNTFGWYRDLETAQSVVKIESRKHKQIEYRIINH